MEMCQNRRKPTWEFQGTSKGRLRRLHSEVNERGEEESKEIRRGRHLRGTNSEDPETSGDPDDQVAPGEIAGRPVCPLPTEGPETRPPRRVVAPVGGLRLHRLLHRCRRRTHPQTPPPPRLSSTGAAPAPAYLVDRSDGTKERPKQARSLQGRGEGKATADPALGASIQGLRFKIGDSSGSVWFAVNSVKVKSRIQTTMAIECCVLL